MNESILDKLNGIIQPLLDNPYFYFFISVLIYCLGGVDELLKALLCLTTVDVIVCFLSKERSNEGIFKQKLKIFLMIVMGTMVDKMLGLEGHPTLSARSGLLYGYGYNEGVSIINTLCMDSAFYIPKSIRKHISKLKEKGDNENDE